MEKHHRKSLAHDVDDMKFGRHTPHSEHFHNAVENIENGGYMAHPPGGRFKPRMP